MKEDGEKQIASKDLPSFLVGLRHGTYALLIEYFSSIESASFVSAPKEALRATSWHWAALRPLSGSPAPKKTCVAQSISSYWSFGLRLVDKSRLSGWTGINRRLL